MKTVHTLCATFLMSCVAAFVCGNAIAAEMVTKQRTVSYGDLNLSNPEGVNTLYRRIRGAARSVCGNTSEVIPVLRGAHRECVRKALDDAVAQVDNHDLTALHTEKTGRSDGAKVASRR